MKKPDVLLLHGVLMNSVEMLYLQRQLELSGFTVHNFFYPSVRKDVAQNTKTLCEKIHKLKLDQLHIVAHSMGGIMTMHLLEHCKSLPMGRVVMLGTPLNGSYTANKVSSWPVVNQLLEKSMPSGLDGSYKLPETTDRDIGMIAGSNDALGFGVLFGGMPEGSDGTVLLSETKHGLLKEHIIVNTTHTGMIFSHQTAELATRFLKTGSFSV
jgi:pimeloyl-ACP methyl ester carboxylesterase